MGIVAHPSEITGLAVSFDGQFLFTGGGSDLSVNMWKLDCNQISTNSSALAPFYGLLDGGEGGELHRDIVDYFYYCQLRHMGEDSMEPRNLHGNCHKNCRVIAELFGN